MQNVLSILQSSLELGFIYGIITLGLVVSLRIIGFADLTMEGSFTLGAAITSVSITAGINPFCALLLGGISGSVAGLCTGFLHTKTGISKLLSGIIMMTILYSLNLRIMGKPNYSILDKQVVFDLFPTNIYRISFDFFIVVGISLLLLFLLKTDFGLTLRAIGENPSVVTRLGANKDFFTIFGLMLSNCIIAFAGGIVAQNNGFADIGMGIGILISTLAALMIGEAILPPTNIFRLLLSAIIGSIIYQMIIAICLRLGINPWDLKFATGILLALAVTLKRYIKPREAVSNIGCHNI